MTRRPALVVVCGHPATGKTTTATAIGEALGLPVLTKDGVKERLADVLGCADRATSQALGHAATRVLLAHAEALLRAGTPVVAESNFPPLSEPHLVEVVERTGATAITVVCTSPPEVALRRFAARAGTRHACHFDVEMVDELAERLRAAYRPPALHGPSIEVDIDRSDALPRAVAAVSAALAG